MNKEIYDDLSKNDTTSIKFYIQSTYLHPRIKDIILLGGLLTALSVSNFTSTDINISEDNASLYEQFSESATQKKYNYLSCQPEIDTDINDDAPLELSISKKIKVKIGKIEPLEFSAIEDEKGFI